MRAQVNSQGRGRPSQRHPLEFNVAVVLGSYLEHALGELEPRLDGEGVLRSAPLEEPLSELD